MPFQAVIFDLVGVLLVEGEPDARRRWEQRLGLDPGILNRELDEAARAYSEGVPVAEIRRRMGETFGLSADELSELEADLAGDMRLDATLTRFIAEIRGSCRVGILSNNDQPGARADLNARFGLEALVDSVVLSGEVGFDKPHPAIYRAAVDQLGVAADSCVFVDDSPGHVAGARSAGMTAFVHTDPDSTVAALRELLGRR